MRNNDVIFWFMRPTFLDFNILEIPKFTFPIKSGNYLGDIESYAKQIPNAKLQNFNDLSDRAFDTPPPGFGLWDNGTAIIGIFQQEFSYGRILSMNLISNIMAGNNKIGNNRNF